MFHWYDVGMSLARSLFFAVVVVLTCKTSPLLATYMSNKAEACEPTSSVLQEAADPHGGGGGGGDDDPQ